MHLFDLDDKVAAAAIAAAGTVFGALIQLRAAWRREVSERARGVPVTKKSRRGPVLAVGLLLIAAAVGGFALSQFWVAQSDRESAAVRGELQTQLKQISATAERLERATLRDHDSTDHAAAGHAAIGSVTVTATLGPCRARTIDRPDVAAGCAASDAVQLTLCASVASSATVTDTLLYARPEQSRQPWNDSRLDAGQGVGRVSFPDKPFERAEAAQSKQVCAVFISWDGEQAYSARLVVKYISSAPAAGDLSNASLVPTSGLSQ
jgi:hypothetical protein